MKLKFEKCFNGFLILLTVALLWSVWAGAAQTAPTNGVTVEATAANTNGTAADFLTRLEQAESNATPGWVEKLAADLPFLKWHLWGNELWKYFASLIYIFLAFYVSKLLDYLTRVWLKRWTDKTGTKFDDLVLDLLNGPVKVVSFVIFLHIGLSVFRWPATVQRILAKSFTVIVACSLTYMTLKFVDLALGYWRKHAKISDANHPFNEQLFPIVRKSLKAFVVVVAALVTAQNLDINVTAAITSLSIGGLAVGLAAQDTLANLFGAVAVFADKPFSLGDTIKIDAVEGTVESIGIRSTRVRNPSGHLVTIPNKTVANATIINISRRPNIRTEMNLRLRFDVPAEKVQSAVQILEEVYRGHPMTQDLTVSFNKFGDSSMNILIVHFWKALDTNQYLAGMQQLNLAIKERFDKEGISLAPP